MADKTNLHFKNSKTSRFLFILISTAIGIALFEIIIRSIWPQPNLNVNWRYHSILGWTQVPGTKYEIKIDGRNVLVEFNSKGFRDVEHSIRKNPGTRRIVVIGDSFSEAAQVNLNEVYFRRLHSKLNEQSGQKWEIINLSVGDFGTTQEWIALHEYGWSYSPDIILHQIFPLNDICNNQIELFDLCKSNNDHYRPYFVESNGNLNLTMKQPHKTFIRQHLVSYCLAEITLNRIFALDPARSEKRRSKRLREQNLTKLDPLLYTYASDKQQIPQIAKGWTLTEQIIQKIIYECKLRKARYLAVIIPFQVCVNNTIWGEFTAETSSSLIRDYPERRLQKFFDANGIPSVAILDAMGGIFSRPLFLSDGHLSADGHSLTAEAIYKKLKEGDFLQ